MTLEERKQYAIRYFGYYDSFTFRGETRQTLKRGASTQYQNGDRYEFVQDDTHFFSSSGTYTDTISFVHPIFSGANRSFKRSEGGTFVSSFDRNGGSFGRTFYTSSMVTSTSAFTWTIPGSVRTATFTVTSTLTYTDNIANDLKIISESIPPFTRPSYEYPIFGTSTLLTNHSVQLTTTSTNLAPSGSGSTVTAIESSDWQKKLTYTVKESLTTTIVGQSWSTTTTRVGHPFTYVSRDLTSPSPYSLERVVWVPTATVFTSQEVLNNRVDDTIATVRGILDPYYLGLSYTNPNDVLTNGQTFDRWTTFTITLPLMGEIPNEAGTVTTEESIFDYNFIPVATITQAQEIFDENGETSLETWTEISYDWVETFTVTTYTQETNAGLVLAPFSYTTAVIGSSFGAIVKSGTISAPRISWDEDDSGSTPSTFSLVTGVTTDTTLLGTTAYSYENHTTTEAIPKFTTSSAAYTNYFEAYLVATAVNGWVIPNSGFERRDAASTQQQTFLMSVGLARPGVSLYPPLGSPTPLFYTQTVTHWGNLDMAVTDTAPIPSPTTAAFTQSFGSTTKLSPDVFAATVEGQSVSTVSTVRVQGQKGVVLSQNPYAGNAIGMNVNWTLVVPEPGFLIIYGDTTTTYNFTCPTTSVFQDNNKGSFFVFERRPYGHLLATPKFNYDEF